MGKLFDTGQSKAADEGEFALLNDSKSAFLARIALADMAEQTIDIQLFIWDDDISGLHMTDRLLRAADRGVRIRLLIDDVGNKGADQNLVLLDSHENIEVRLFNPTAGRHFARAIELIWDFDRLNRRMHNKAYTVDNQVSIVGGRNIADRYFGVDRAYNYRDIDVTVAGSVVKKVSQNFDEFWNYPLSVPISSLSMLRFKPETVAKKEAALRAYLVRHSHFPYTNDIAGDKPIQYLREYRRSFVPAKATVLYDPPGKIFGSQPLEMTKALWKRASEAREEILIASPYVGSIAPEEPDLYGLVSSRGISIKMLTSSLAGNNTVISQSGYAAYRKSLLQNGVELYELQPYPALKQEHTGDPGLNHVLGLHSKVVVYDREVSFVGSYNFDPRSAHLNTELGIMISSREISRQLVEILESDIAPENSWRVRFSEAPHTFPEVKHNASRIIWIERKDGREIRYPWDPKTGLYRRFSQFLVGLLPIDHLL